MSTVTVRKFEVEQARPDELQQMIRLKQEWSRQFFPDDPVPPDALVEKNLRSPNPNMIYTHYGAWQGEQLVGYACYEVNQPGRENQHAAHLGGFVDPAFRRQGVATRLLRALVAQAGSEGRTLLTGWAADRVPEGLAFWDAQGAERALGERCSEMRFAGLERSRFEEEQVLHQARASEDIELIFRENGPSDAELPAFCQLMTTVQNLAPLENLEMEPWVVRPEEKRAGYDNGIAKGRRYWLLAARSKSTGRLAGYTEVAWEKDSPGIVWQCWTGVHPDFQGRGIGRLLKTAMVVRLLDRGGVKLKRTWNAGSNDAMLRINIDLGYRPALTTWCFQVEREALEQRLAGASLGSAALR